MTVMWISRIRDHKWLAVRAILVGWAALFALWIAASSLIYFDDWLFVTGLADIRSFWPDPRRPLFHFLIGCGVNAAAGWIVGRLYREYRTLMVPLFFASQ